MPSSENKHKHPAPKRSRRGPLLDLLESAGKLIMEYYNSKAFEIESKADDSPVTTADKASNDLIIDGLTKLYPDIPIISEETTQIPYDIRKNWEYCWMLDPLDGTKEFIKRNGEFSINLALIHNHKPVEGYIHFPVQDWTYWAQKGKGAWKTDHLDIGGCDTVETQNFASLPRTSHIRIMISRSHAGQREHDFISQVKKLGYVVETLPHGSAMKHCLIAEGKGDIYPKFGICSEWDTAPGQIILEESGGKITQTDTGEALLYNKEDFANPEFIMWGNNVPKDLLNSLLNS